MKRFRYQHQLKPGFSLNQIKKLQYQFNTTSSGMSELIIGDISGEIILNSLGQENFEKDQKILQELISQTEESFLRSKEEKIFKHQNKVIYEQQTLRKVYRPTEIMDLSDLRIDAKGRYSATGWVAKLIQNLDREFLKIAGSLDAAEFISNLIWDELELNSIGYSKNNPYLFHFHDQSQTAHHVLQNAACTNVWRHFKNHPLEGPKILTTIGFCGRFEGRQQYLFEYLPVFQMREIVCIGSTDNVQNFRSKCIEAVCDILKKFELQSQLVVADDPFFMQGEKNHQQNYYSLPENIKYEARLNIYDDKTLACASFNIHGDFFSKNLSIGTPGKLWTACTAFGIERWIWAILLQHGPETKSWPDALKMLIK